MTRGIALSTLLLAFSFTAAQAEDRVAPYEVHEWGFVAVNSPPTHKNLESYLQSLPGEIRRPNLSATVQRRATHQSLPQGANAPSVGHAGNGGAGAQPPSTAPNGMRNTERDHPQPGTNPPNGQNSGLRPPEHMHPQPRGSVSAINDPFMWFHADRPLRVRVRVDLGKNSPICWWPQGLDKPHSIEWRRVTLRTSTGKGKRLESLKGRDADFVETLLKSRTVDSSFVNTGNKVEKFLMYEFSGLYQTGLRVRKIDDCLLLDNRGELPIRDLFLIYGDDPDSKIVYVPTLGAGARNVRSNEACQGGDLGFMAFRARLAERLEAGGLFPDEAAAMSAVVTGNDGFTGSAGVKAVFRLYQREADNIAPLHFSPAPRRLNRVWLALVWDAEKLK